MPPRHNYWTIIFGNQPTSFRAATREELLPTFRQIQAKHPDAVMMWFASGRLWRSEEEFRNARFQRRDQSRGRDNRDRPRGPQPAWKDRPRSPRDPQQESRGPRPAWRDRPRGPRPAWKDKPRDGEPAQPPRPKDRWRDRPAPPPGAEAKRGRDWRPGGQHKDPRDRFKVPRDVKRARFKDKLRRDRMHPKPPKKKDEE